MDVWQNIQTFFNFYIIDFIFELPILIDFSIYYLTLYVDFFNRFHVMSFCLIFYSFFLILYSSVSFYLIV